MDTGPQSKAAGPNGLEDVLLSSVKPPPGRTIFFHETRCHPTNSHYILNLTARQACAIESAALHNPNFQVFVLFASRTHIPDNNDPRAKLLNAIVSYKNVHLRQLNLWQYAKDTPIEDWLKKGDLLSSKYVLIAYTFLPIFYPSIRTLFKKVFFCTF